MIRVCALMNIKQSFASLLYLQRKKESCTGNGEEHEFLIKYMFSKRPKQLRTSVKT